MEVLLPHRYQAPAHLMPWGGEYCMMRQSVGAFNGDRIVWSGPKVWFVNEETAPSFCSSCRAKSGIRGGLLGTDEELQMRFQSRIYLTPGRT
jgi:hypothetical protein